MLRKVVTPLLLLLPSLVLGQDFLNVFSPDAPKTMLELEGTFLPDSAVDNSRDETHVFFHSADIQQRVYGDEQRSLSVGAKYQKLDLNSSHPYLNDYYNQQGSLTYRQKLSDNRFWLGNVSYGSSSDRPFKSSRDSTIGANFIYKFSPKWFGVANYSNNRAFLNNIPLPGFFYIKEMERNKVFIVGFPLIFWMRPLGDNWSFRYFGLLPWSHRFRLFYENFKSVKPYVGVEQQPLTFFRHDRDERYNRFFWFERRMISGFEGDLAKNLRYEVWGGFSFDRQFFEARNFSEKKEFLVNLDTAYLLGLNLRFKF